MNRSVRRGKLESWLNRTSTGVFLLDAKRRITFFNAGLEQLTGWEAKEVRGQRCDYSSSESLDGVAALASSLCPPPEVLDGEIAIVPTYVIRRTDAALARMIHFFPLLADAGSVDAVIGVVTKIGTPPASTPISPAQQLHAELAALRIRLRQRFGSSGMVAHSTTMLRATSQAHLARDSSHPFSLCGEPGTGKEHVARLVHYEGPTATRSFVPLDCAQLSPREIRQTIRRVLESTDEAAIAALNPGTLYLSNVDRLPRELQEQLVSAYSQEPQPTVRLIASSSIDLSVARGQDALRNDFYYLITTLRIELPALRDRPADLRPLAQHFLELQNRDSDRQMGGFSEDVWDQFEEYNWPGNLDELSRVVQESCASSKDATVQLDDLPFSFRTGQDAQTVGPTSAPTIGPLEESVRSFEADLIRRALSACRDNKAKAAKMLGLTRPRLYRRMDALGLTEADDD